MFTSCVASAASTSRMLLPLLSFIFVTLLPDASELSKELPACEDAKRSNDAVRSFLALSALGASEQARSCLLLHLKKPKQTPAAWALAATVFSSQPAFLEHAKSLLKSKPNQQRPISFDMLGPLPIGKSEADGDPVAALGGAWSHWLQEHNTTRARIVASELVPGGHVGWQSLRAAPDGTLPVAWQEMQSVWGGLVQALGQRAVLEVQAWVMFSLAVVETGHYQLHCRGVHKIMLHDASQPHALPLLVNGDIYSAGHAGGGGFGIGQLYPGAYVVSMRVRAVVQAQPSCTLTPVQQRAAWSAASPQQVPDIILGSDDHSAPRLCGGYVGVPVKNSGKAGWMRGVSVRSRDPHVTARLVHDNVDIAPAALRLLPVEVSLNLSQGNGSVACPFGTTLELRATPDDSSQGGGGDDGVSVLTVRVGSMQCRSPSQSIICTHIDHDGAVSAAAILRPLAPESCDPTFGCPAIVTLHGTSRPVRDSADAYKHKPRGTSDDEPYTFGVDRFWVVAPTRHGAHNWEQGGRLTALTALDALSATAESYGIARLPSAARVDAHRVLFCGHSMGGHGAWDTAVHAASRAIGVASVSGWLRKETYGDSNFLFTQSVNDINSSYVEPALEGVLRASLGENDLELHLPLLRHVPHLARTGDADNTVHSFWARRAQRLLASAEGSGGLSPSSRLSELKGKEHWWWDTLAPNDGGAVNDEEMRGFFASVLGPPHTRPVLPKLPHDFLLMAHSSASFDGRAGWKILQMHQPARMSTIRIRSNSSTIDGVLELTTRNVRRLSASRSALRESDSPYLRIDGDHVDLAGEKGEGEVELCRMALPAVSKKHSRWRPCDTSEEAERRPSTAGPIRQAMHAPFTIVPGGGGGNVETARELERLAVFLANLFTITSDVSPPVTPDADVRVVADETASNLILVGGPRENAATLAIAAYWRQVGHSATWNANGGLHIGGCEIPSSGVGALILGPRPGGGLALVIDGDDAGRRDAIAAGEPTIPPMARSPFSNTLPDYIVTGPEFAAKGFGGLLAAGFFDYRWRVAPAASFVALDCP